VHIFFDWSKKNIKTDLKISDMQKRKRNANEGSFNSFKQPPKRVKKSVIPPADVVEPEVIDEPFQQEESTRNLRQSALSSTKRISILYETFGHQGGTRHSTEKFKLSYICPGLNVETEEDIEIEISKGSTKNTTSFEEFVHHHALSIPPSLKKKKNLADLSSTVLKGNFLFLRSLFH
jgi:hypothetical protein